MPFEIWKTYMGMHRSTRTMEAFHIIYARGGVGAFWKGWQPKAVESFLKGGVLLFSKEAIIRVCQTIGASDVTAGLIGGFGGGVAQVAVVGPCSYLVTASVTGDKSIGMMERITQTYQRSGIGGFYKGGTALMLRQGSNWASRQGLTDIIREQLKKRHPGDPKKVKLSTAEEALAGIFGGALSTWNQPFEVMRIEAQAAAAKVRAVHAGVLVGIKSAADYLPRSPAPTLPRSHPSLLQGMPSMNVVQTAQVIVKDSGVAGLFQGIWPRMGLCVWQTLFMVTIPYLLKPYGL